MLSLNSHILRSFISNKIHIFLTILAHVDVNIILCANKLYGPALRCLPTCVVSVLCAEILCYARNKL